MASPFFIHNTSAQHEESFAMNDVTHETAHSDHQSSSRSAEPASISSKTSSDAPNQAEHPQPSLDLSGRRLVPVIYTKHHFEELKLSAVQYAKEMIERHEDLGVVVTQRDMNRHWRKQVRREYNKSHPMRAPLLQQVLATHFMIKEDSH